MYLSDAGVLGPQGRRSRGKMASRIEPEDGETSGDGVSCKSQGIPHGADLAHPATVPPTW